MFFMMARLFEDHYGLRRAVFQPDATKVSPESDGI